MNTSPPNTMNRRSFIAASAAIGAGIAAARVTESADSKPVAAEPCPLCLFTKYLGSRNYAQLGEALRELGFHYADLTVRRGGHVEPARATDDLPRAHEALAKAGVAVGMVTTDILTADQPHAADVVRTTQKLGIGYLKPGYYTYRDMDAVAQSFNDARAKLRDVVALAAAHDVVVGYHNHSGANVGSLLWDAWGLIRELNPAHVGSFFDACHATIEGGLAGWRIGLNLLLPRITMIAVKSFVWKQAGTRWSPHMAPLAEGAVQWPEVFARLKTAGFRGPISLHMEYSPRGEPGSDEEKQLFAAIRKDAAFLREQLAATGLQAT